MTAYTKPPVCAPRKLAFSSQVIADHDHQILYVLPPKCAQTSLRLWIGPEVESPVRFEKVPALRDYLVVMSVRNPYHRFVSAWRNKFSNVTFDALLNHALGHGDMALDIHLQSQSHLLDLAGIDEPDLFLRVGPDLADDVANFAMSREWLEQRELTHENVSGATMGPFMDLPNEVLDMFKFRYRDDFNLWEIANGCTE